MVEECVYGDIGGTEPKKELAPDLAKAVSEHYIFLSGVSKSYGDKVVVNDISLIVDEGETLCILGESGSGKSTLLKLIAGHLDTDGGEIYVDEEMIEGPTDKLVPGYKHIKLIHQNIKLSQFKTIHDNLKSATYEFKPEFREDKVKELLKLTKLEDKVDAFPPELSGGQQQRIAIGAALANEPDVALLDEPFSHLDVPLKAEIRKDLMTMLDELGMTTIFVSHDANDAFAVADKVVVLREGIIQQSGTPEEIYRNPVNEYVAGFFGPVNVLKIEDATLLVRPEQIRLSDNGTYTGKVKESTFYGFHYLNKVESDMSQEEITIYSKEKFEVGTEIKFDYSE
ncbi:ABC transporter ATP-binding protein [Reichenbachiella versicolor]|uniref:ABC transporter ATP-binding protein n=1 Tax=Reichenbachiella versicolor TaxID=1821036 RepID=UPI000D6E2BAF|nr:ABC transporter ATP-binding protein [Reichenbachiella versicolor]